MDFRQGREICLFAVFLRQLDVFCRGIADNSRNSRFGGFNSRLGHKNSRFARYENLLAGAWFRLPFLGANGSFAGKTEKIAASTGKSGNSAVTQRNGPQRPGPGVAAGPSARAIPWAKGHSMAGPSVRL